MCDYFSITNIGLVPGFALLQPGPSGAAGALAPITSAHGVAFAWTATRYWTTRFVSHKEATRSRREDACVRKDTVSGMQWHFQFPTCFPAECHRNAKLILSANMWSNGRSIGSIAQYTCNNGLVFPDGTKLVS